MSNPLPTYYWDACIFYEWLRREPVSTQKSLKIRNLLNENAARKNVIVTSSVTHMEVLPKKLTEADAENEKKYWNFFQSIYFFDIPIDKQIISLSREIKNYYYDPGDSGAGTKYKMLSTGDSIHLATAIVHQATELHTRDKNTRGGNVPLLGLDKASPGGLIAGRWPLTIVSPEEAQADLEEIVKRDTPPGGAS